MDKPKFAYVVYIATTPEKLWAALTTGEFSEQYWFGRRVQCDWRPGAKITYTYDNGRKIDLLGEILRCEPPRVLSFTFQDQHSGERPSRVTFEIEAMPAMVRLTLIHNDFRPDSKVLEGISKGWPAILSSLKSLLETGRGLDLGTAGACGEENW